MSEFFLHKNHLYEYEKIGSPIESFLLDHIIKFLSPETKIQLQYPITTMSGNFRADIALIKDDKVVILECDGQEHHTKEKDDWYDEWRDALILVQRKAKAIYRIKGRDIYNNTYAILSMINKYDPDLFVQDQITRLPEIEIEESFLRKCCYTSFLGENGDEIDYTIVLRRRDTEKDFDSHWLKYIMYSMLFPGHNVNQLIEIFKSRMEDSSVLVKNLNHLHPELKLTSDRDLLKVTFLEKEV